MNENLPHDLGRRIGDIKDLPEELIRRLQIGKVGEVEQAIVAMIRDDFDGVANLDEILVGLYRWNGQVYARQLIANKLYRMNKAGQIVSVAKRKGVYSSV